MTWLLDTNVVSEVRRGPRCDPAVRAWFDSVGADDLRLSVLVLGEIRKGIDKARPRDPRLAGLLEDWLGEVVSSFGDRILPVDRRVADEWGRMSAIRTVPVIDGLLAATAKVHGITFVTRDAKAVQGLGARVLNPFLSAAS